MINKKAILLLLISALLIVLFSAFAQAGCCIFQNLGTGCQASPNQGNCSTSPQFFTTDNCVDRTECALGCCCTPSNVGTGATNYSCVSPNTFTPDPNIIPGDSCSCVTGSYTVAGLVRDTANAPLSGVIVASQGRTTQSGADGRYVLTQVPAGTVDVTAYKTGCLPKTNTIVLDSDKANINFLLNCVCQYGQCDTVNKGYCTSASRWEVPIDKSVYCSYCGTDDPVYCNVTDICVGGDRQCPLSCSPNNQNSNYDPDCVCSPTSNGVCPLWCSPDPGSSFDVDCAAYTAVCGDNVTTYPFENCEDGPLPGYFTLCAADDCANPGEPGECNCLSLKGCGNLILESGEECEIGMICTNGRWCENCECGPPQCVDSVRNPTLAVNFDDSNNVMLLSWSLLSACLPSVREYNVYRCEKFTPADCAAKNLFGTRFASTNDLNYTDNTIAQASEYCYYVEAVYFDNSEGESDIKCESTGEAYCMNQHPAEFCIDNIRTRCDADNNFEQIEDCDPNKFCLGPDRDENTWCSSIGVCDLCNGLYGMFSNLPDLYVIPDPTNPLDRKYCHKGMFSRELVTGCYIDRTKTLFNAFDYCANIVSCYDYKSEIACEDSNDPCAKNQGCEWMPVYSTYSELGGLCRPKDQALQDCELCDDEDYNWLSPSCTPRICSLFGQDCRYQGRSAQYSCSDRSTLKCSDYSSQQQCTRGQPVVVDAQYDTNNIRTGGDHNLIPSNDTYQLGKCYWVQTSPNMGRCYRNADNLPINFTTNIGWDCPSGRDDCFSDFENPVTTIDTICSGIYPVCPRDVKIKYSVGDDRFYGADLETYFCVAPGTQSCYPTVLAGGGLFETSITTPGENMPYTVYYYSKDLAQNLEEVERIDIRVDTIYPVMTIRQPSMGVFNTAVNTVNLVGSASTDTRYICSYVSSNPSQKTCIYSCGVQGMLPPCIDPATGDFTMTITVPPTNAVYETSFDLEDFAGNKVEDWRAISIYYNNTPLVKPIIIIE